LRHWSAEGQKKKMITGRLDRFCNNEVMLLHFKVQSANRFRWCTQTNLFQVGEIPVSWLTTSFINRGSTLASALPWQFDNSYTHSSQQWKDLGRLLSSKILVFNLLASPFNLHTGWRESNYDLLLLHRTANNSFGKRGRLLCSTLIVIITREEHTVPSKNKVASGREEAFKACAVRLKSNQ
jgi:hypothetical protein